MWNTVRRYLIPTLGTLLIFGFGALGIWYEGRRAHEDLRDEILYTVDLALAATDPDNVEALIGSLDDLTNPVYIRLREQYQKLHAPLQQKNIRWIYVMREVGDQIIFLIDSVEVEDPGHSEPGVVYERPPQGLYTAWRSVSRQFTGPYTDEYGTYYSVFAPIHRHSDGTVIAALGADIEADVFMRIVRSRQRLPVILTLFTEIIFILVFLYFHRHNQIERLKSEFISIASHQLKSPITALRWVVEGLVKDTAKKRYASVHEQVLASQEIVRHMNDLVNALLNVSRVETGRIAVHTEMTNMALLAKNAITEVSHSAKAKKQKITVSADEGLVKISVDPLLITEVLKNLLTNAIKYTPKGGEISIRVSKSGSDILTRVADNGYGIPKHEQKRVFHKFYRGTNIVSLEPDGNGLGLYLVKRIVDISGGKIWFDSTEGQGTTFSFTLPISGSAPRRGEKSLA